MPFNFSVKKVMDGIYSADIKSELDNELEYDFVLYYMSLLRKQYAKSVIKAAGLAIEPESVTIFNFAQHFAKSADPATKYHIMLLGIENSLLKPLADEIQKKTGNLPENPFAEKGKHGMPGFNPRKV